MGQPLPLIDGYALERTSLFAYRCAACGICCHNKIIPLNPFEVAKIAEHLGISTTRMLAEYTATGGATLQPLEGSGACVFLGPQGCQVHPARPLACRLYPLGRHLSPKGEERFGQVVPQQGCKGQLGGPGTVQDWLDSQGADPYILFSDRYVALLRSMLAALSQRSDLPEVRDSASEQMQRAPREDDGSLLDVDAVVRALCDSRGIDLPSRLEDRIDLHIAALEEWIGYGGTGVPLQA